MSQYNAEDIEVLSGLEPVQRRPGMYTDTSRPNHLAQEVIDNSVDEAVAGHAKTVEVTVYTDGSVEVIDDGRGMPVDLHEGVFGLAVHVPVLIIVSLLTPAQDPERVEAYVNPPAEPRTAPAANSE